MNGSPLAAVMFFVDEPEIVATWWASNLGDGADVIDEGDFYYFEAGDIEFGFHPNEDGRNPHGASPVLYLSVPDVVQKRLALLERGCTMHRGPLRINADRQICQMIDPFDNTFGLDGA
jgi:hypothetical protein